MEEWAKAWLEGQRAKGVTRLEIKVVNGCNYVYDSTTIWDKKLKKRVKKSTYLGRLDPVLGLVEGKKHMPATTVVSIREQGNALLLDRLFEDLWEPLADAFPVDQPEIYAMAVLKALQPTPLSLARTRWEKLADIHGLDPNLEPRHLADMYRRVGMDREAQDVLFRALAIDGKELIYDLSSIFSQSGDVNLAEKGYNPDHVNLRQVNMALVCSADRGLPTMVRALPGSVKDVRTVYASMLELGVKGKILVMDRGFFSVELFQFLEANGLDYVVPAHRGNSLYDNVELSDGEFVHRGKLVRFGKAWHDGRCLYLFENTVLRLEEETKLSTEVISGAITKEQKQVEMRRAGRILMVSSLDRDPEEIYQIYKRRDKVEKQFEKWKSDLQADATHLQETAVVFGHFFISFLSLYLLAKLENAIRDAGLLNHHSTRQVLEEYSKAYLLQSTSGPVHYEIPKKVRDLDKKLGFKLLP
jgi:hypothetical protein